MLKTDAKIMLADDSKVVRLALARIFEMLGYTNIIQAGDGVEAVALHSREQPDLIFLDIVMPLMRGDEALAKIRAADAKTPIIMLSSVAKQTEIDYCKSLGITDYLIKPVTVASGESVIGEQLARLN